MPYGIGLTKPFRQSFDLTLPLPTEVEAFRRPSFRVSETEVIPLLGEMSATADKRVPVFRRKRWQSEALTEGFGYISARARIFYCNQRTRKRLRIFPQPNFLCHLYVNV